MYMHSTLQSYVRNAKINLQNNPHNITSTTRPNLSFYLRETYRICNFLANCCDYARKQYKAPISFSPEVYETSSRTGSRIRILYLLTGPIRRKVSLIRAAIVDRFTAYNDKPLTDERRRTFVFRSRPSLSTSKATRMSVRLSTMGLQGGP